MILVTGANGQLGRLVIQSLLHRVPASQIVAGARRPDTLADLAAAGVTVRHLDYLDPASAQAAMAGVTRVLLISGSDSFGRRAELHGVVIDAARAAGVELLAYTSVLHADRSGLALAADHLATEKKLLASGVPYALLRCGWYIENYTANLESTLSHGVLLGAAGQGKLAPAARADLAEAAAVVLTGEGHHNRTYELAGDTAYSLADLAAEMSRVSGKAVRYQDLPAAVYRDTLLGFGLPAAFAELLADSDEGIARGDLDDQSGDLHRLIGRSTATVGEVLEKTLGA